MVKFHLNCDIYFASAARFSKYNTEHASDPFELSFSTLESNLDLLLHFLETRPGQPS